MPLHLAPPRDYGYALSERFEPNRTSFHPTYHFSLPTIPYPERTIDFVLPIMSIPIPAELWTNPLRLKLHTTCYGEFYIPFANHVQQAPTGSSLCPVPPQHQLPKELMLRILFFCDSATLYRFMQVSSMYREEAKKLFWSDPTILYHVSGCWLLSGAFSGHSQYAADFFAHVERLDIEFNSMEEVWTPWDDSRMTSVPEYLWDAIDSSTGQALTPAATTYLESRIQSFWCTLQYCFPRVTHVVLSESRPRRAHPPAPRGELRRMAELCPSEIRVAASHLQAERECQLVLGRRLYEPIPGDDSAAAEWRVVDAQWTRPSVLPPIKNFNGPVGAFYHTLQKRKAYFALQSTAAALVVAAVEWHYIHEKHAPFTCPYPGCNLFFDTPGQWPRHAVVADGHAQDAGSLVHIQQILTEWNYELERELEEECVSVQRQMKLDWAEKQNEEPRLAEVEFLSQLAQDPQYAFQRSGKESLAWRLYMDLVNQDAKSGIDRVL